MNIRKKRYKRQSCERKTEDGKGKAITAEKNRGGGLTVNEDNKR